jgi:hypothetical protein
MGRKVSLTYLLNTPAVPQNRPVRDFVGGGGKVGRVESYIIIRNMSPNGMHFTFIKYAEGSVQFII